MRERVHEVGGCSKLSRDVHDSFANCAQPIKAKLESFMVDDMKYCGLLNETDLTQVQQRIIASGTLTVDEMNTFFLKK